MVLNGHYPNPFGSAAVNQLCGDIKSRQNQELEQQNEQRHREEQSQVVSEFLGKVQSSGRGDQIKTTGIGRLYENHPFIPLLNSFDNMDDMLDHFSENPEKVPQLAATAWLDPDNGFRAMKKVSESIKRNKEALAKEKAPVPQSQLKPSSYGLGGGGTESVSDLRKNPMLRF